MAEPRSYEEILARKCVLGRDFRVEFGDSNVDRCLLIAPHGGGIEPGTSEIMRAVAELGGWAWYEFAGFLRKGNKEALHLGSTDFNEPTLMNLLPQTPFVVAFHGANESSETIVFVGGKWDLGREVVVRSINVVFNEHKIHAADATKHDVAEHLRGLEDSNITNRGRLTKGVQLEFSRGARNALFPPDSSREARGRRSPLLRSVARSIHTAIEELCQHCR
ncbi:MAG: replication protein [Bryobacterales bacterium]|nr:replication protein [Bryobacterales bacterium]